MVSNNDATYQRFNWQNAARHRVRGVFTRMRKVVVGETFPEHIKSELKRIDKMSRFTDDCESHVPEVKLSESFQRISGRRVTPGDTPFSTPSSTSLPTSPIPSIYITPPSPAKSLRTPSSSSSSDSADELDTPSLSSSSSRWSLDSHDTTPSPVFSSPFDTAVLIRLVDTLDAEREVRVAAMERFKQSRDSYCVLEDILEHYTVGIE